jgi:hypothetical protein
MIRRNQIFFIGGIDFSGATDLSSQRKHIFLVYQKHNFLHYQPISENGRTRCELLSHLKNLFSYLKNHNQYAILGCDFSFSFPQNFYSAYTHRPFKNYIQILNLFDKCTCAHFQPHAWAKKVNQALRNQFPVSTGPFWGPSFKEQRHKPENLKNFPFHQKRFCEKLIPKTHSIFQLGGHGSVGLQSLHGILFLKELWKDMSVAGITTHIWPNMGTQIPSPPAVLIFEMYPGILHEKTKSDLQDAFSIFDFLFKSFILNQNYVEILQYIEQKIDPFILTEEGFLYGPPEKIFHDTI